MSNIGHRRVALGISYVARDSRWFSGLIQGHPTWLIRDGRLDHNALRAAHMSDDDLDEELRQQGVSKPVSGRSPART